MTSRNVGGVRYNETMYVASQDFPRPEQPAPRLAAVPDASPPYDRESHDVMGQVPGEPARPGLPEVTAFPIGRLATAAVAVPPDNSRSATTRQGTIWPRRIAQAIVETVAGTRPFRQVIPSATEQVQARIQQLMPLLRTGTGVRIRRILASWTDADVVEVTVIAGFGPRTRALAMRFEHQAARTTALGLPPRPARWLCTDIETA